MRVISCSNSVAGVSICEVLVGSLVRVVACYRIELFLKMLHCRNSNLQILGVDFVSALGIMFICAAIAKASLSTQATSNGFPLVSEEPTPVVSKKERLSRQERTAVVESFVQKCVEHHLPECAFFISRTYSFLVAVISE